LKQLLVAELGFPASIKLLGRTRDATPLYTLKPAQKLVEGSTITVHGCETLHPNPPTAFLALDRTQEEMDWAFQGNPPRVTIPQTVHMFQDLKAGFGTKSFQDELLAMHRMYLRSPRNSLNAEARSRMLADLALTVQSKVVAKFGFEGTHEGVTQMRLETADLFNLDDRLKRLSREIQDLLGFKDPANDSERKPPNVRIINSRRFALSDVVGWKEHLTEQGFVVIAGIASAEQRKKAYSLLWDFIEASDRAGRIRRDDVSTWQDSSTPFCGWPAGKEDGIIHSRGVGQSELLWYLRSLPQLRQVFKSIWGTDALVTSFDGAGVFRPFGREPSWKTTRKHWYHVDQAHLKPGLHCIQGLITLTDATEARGGLVVVPGSHRFHAQVLRRYKTSEWNFIQLKVDDDVIADGGGGPRLVGAQAGDLVLWDSRTIHCNTLPLKTDPLQRGEELVRAVAYICMTPGAWCTEETLQKRKQAVEKLTTTTHWPHEYHHMDTPKESKMRAVTLTTAQRELVAPGRGFLREAGAMSPGEPSFLPSRWFRISRDNVPLLMAPFVEPSMPIGTVNKGEKVCGHVFGEWLRLCETSLQEVLGSHSGLLAEEQLEAWLVHTGGAADPLNEAGD